ncbi:uncharacterized protein LOC108740889 [Agrilus planipennis]|uniref:Uncharacterized protein LOC108740889 n=1 Tax=Agrilus planipennis TaxID=224129 RepID=A0A1W4X466_AGRPL|nr:uncharacterized protein LOC108740889 [Agrilus planipennis]
MPDVTRTDSQRSDASSTLRPRVSFNRDVHVKRIVPGKTSHNNRGHRGDGGSQQYHVPLVKKEKLSKTKQELAEEAALVLEQIDSVDCVSSKDGPPSHLRYKSHTLPKKYKFPSDVDVYETKRKYNDEFDINNDHPPKKPPRTFAYRQTPEKTTEKVSIINLFKKDHQDHPRKSNLRRSVSDATNLKSKSLKANRQSVSDTDDEHYVHHCNKKQLSPIIENSPKEDYFENKENIPIDNKEDRKRKSPENATRILKDYINELDRNFNKEEPVRKVDPAVDDDVKISSKPEVIIIDVDKAKNISRKKRKLPKFKKRSIKNFNLFGRKKTSQAKKQSKLQRSPASDNLSVQKPRSFATRVQNEHPHDDDTAQIDLYRIADIEHTSPKIKDTIATLEQQNHRNTEMIHSSQQPPEKLPLTRGLTVDTMVKRLSNDKYSPPPPKTNILITPTVTVQHNNNQPFSYIRGVSPDKNYTSHSNNGSRSPQNKCSSPVIYAQVVCDKGLNSNGKQTIHTAYSNGKKHMPHSDSDEGLGCEENVFGRKYEHSYNTRTYTESDKFEEEYPITPKFKKIEYNGFGNLEEFRKMDYKDSSARGQADGMDSKRRESFREPENLDFIKPNFNDLSTRRDLLESRINRRLHEKPYRTSPEHVLKPVAINSTFITEKTSKHYRHGSTSPVGFTEKYVTESRYDKDGQTLRNDYRIRENFGENSPDSAEYEKRYKSSNYNNSFDNEPTSFDSHISDYRSSPENSGRRFETSQTYKHHHSNKYASKGDGRLLRSREHFKSNPEITHRSYEDPFRDRYNESYHDSLRREKYEKDRRSPTKYRSERYLERNDSERKDKFGDSGIENDFKRDSAENFRPRSSPQREYDSEDEGFASSLLIASERQHTDDSFNTRKPKREYDSDRGLRESSSKSRECPVRPERRSNEREYKTKEIKHEYVPRERSIDDGSHYDPRIDKDLEMGRSTLKKIDSKPPKPEKKSSFEKVKQLFLRDSKKKKEKNKEMVPVENLRARYKEYSGSKENLEYRKEKKETNGLKSSHDYFSRRRLSTPSPSPTRETPRKIEPTHGSWFKSLDRLSRKKPKKESKTENQTSTEDEYLPKQTPTKNLRFFGDTDIESNDSVRQKPSAKYRSTLSSANNERNRSQSSRELHNISEETRRSPNVYTRKNSYKSMVDVSESDRDTRGSRLAMKPPMSPSHRTNREMSKNRDDRSRRRRNEVSSVESSTEGDSSQQSQRSVVYLHAATVGDIPGPGYLRNGRRAASREELASNGSSQILSQKKTLSRSFSVLAPWRPRPVRESYDIDYTQYPKTTKNGKYEQKVARNGTSRKESSSTLKKRANETKKSNQNNSTLSRRSRSKESLTQTLRRSKDDVSKGSSSTLYKKKERQPKENNRYYRERDDKKMSQKSMSVESLGRRNNNKENGYHHDVSRSVSMPRDPEKSAGWFKIQKKKKSQSTQRL